MKLLLLFWLLDSSGIYIFCARMCVRVSYWSSGSLSLRILDHKQGNSTFVSLPLVAAEENNVLFFVGH